MVAPNTTTQSSQTFNPLVTLPPWVFTLVLIYVFVYEIIVPGAQLVRFGDRYSSDVYLLYFLSCLSIGLAYLPFIMKLTPQGFLHPLMFPLLWELVKTTAQDPLQLITPFYQMDIGFIKTTTATFGLSDAGLINGNIKFRALEIMSYATFYLGYFATSDNIRPRINSERSFRQLRPGLIFIGLVGVVVIAYFFLSRGGVSAYLSTWSVGRSKATEGIGAYGALFKTLVIIPQIWFFYRGKKSFFNPFFLLFFCAFLFVSFFSAGSRSSILLGLVGYFVIWMVQSQKIPSLSGIAVLLVFFFLFGLLGMLRNSMYDKKADLNMLVTSDFNEVISYATRESKGRLATGSDVAVVTAVPEKADYFYGKTYLAAVLFWVPRAVWKDKPHSAGRYAGNYLFSTVAALPCGTIAEAYWNFSWIGVALIFFLKGFLNKVALNFYLTNPLHPVHLVMYILILLFGLSLYTDDMVRFLQMVLFSVIFFKILKLI